MPTQGEIQTYQTIRIILKVSNQKRIIEKSRKAQSGCYQCLSRWGDIASSSGTYMFKRQLLYDHHCNHGIEKTCDTTKIIADGEMYSCVNFIENNDEVDYAVIQIEKI